jgi:hypothetical protein
MLAYKRYYPLPISLHLSFLNLYWAVLYSGFCTILFKHVFGPFKSSDARLLLMGSKKLKSRMVKEGCLDPQFPLGEKSCD